MPVFSLYDVKSEWALNSLKVMDGSQRAPNQYVLLYLEPCITRITSDIYRIIEDKYYVTGSELINRPLYG